MAGVESDDDVALVKEREATQIDLEAQMQDAMGPIPAHLSPGES